MKTARRIFAWGRVGGLMSLCFIVLVLGSCRDARHRPTEAELSQFGTYVYALDTLQMESSLRAVINADTSTWKANVTVRHRYASAARYEDTPLWFSRQGLSADADTLLAILRRELPAAYLDSTLFRVPQIAADLNVVRLLAFDSLGVSINDALPRLDYNLSRAYVHYCTGQRYGFVRPDRILNKLDIKVGTSDYARLFDYDIKAPDYDDALCHLLSDERMSYLRDSRPQGPVYEALRAAMDTVADGDLRRTLAINIERCRWQMAQPPTEGRRILVNIPAQQLWAIGADSILNMLICCGSTLTKTPLLHSGVSYMQVNPDWIIPQNIVKTDIVRHAGDSAYFARHRYYITDRQTGDTLRVSTVTSAQMLSGRLRIAQSGGRGNSLGRIVFRFPNDFAVYLHDTNNPSAFKRERRTLSHGCIRVQRPFELARFLLPDADEWTLDRLRLSMDLQPESDRGRQYLLDLDRRQREDPTFKRPMPIRLFSYQKVEPHVPVFITYFTAYPNPVTGILEFHPDIYGYDRALLRAFPHSVK